MKLKHLVLSALTVLASSSTMAAATNINFDGTGAPCLFNNTVALTTQYSSSGVTFSNNSGNSNGGGILNQCGGFGFSGHSGTDFLAYNVGFSVITMAFSSAMDNVSIWAADTAGGATLQMQAFNASNVLVSSASVTGSHTWQQLSVAAAGITSVRLSGGAIGGFDDLSFGTSGATVPEPTVLGLVGLGLLGVAASRRRAA